jgi:hypothetical protein
VQLYLAHLEGRRMLVAHQIPDEATVFVHRLSPGSIRNTGCLNDCCVGSEIVDDSNEAIIEDWQLSAENFVEIRNRGAR